MKNLFSLHFYESLLDEIFLEFNRKDYAFVVSESSMICLV